MLRMRRRNCYTGKCSEFNQYTLFLPHTIVNKAHFLQIHDTLKVQFFLQGKVEEGSAENASSKFLYSPLTGSNLMTLFMFFNFFLPNQTSKKCWMNEWGWKWTVAENLRLNCSLGVHLIIAWTPMIIFPRAKQIVWLSLFLDDPIIRIFVSKQKVSWWFTRVG